MADFKDTIHIIARANDYTLITYIKGGNREWNVAYKFDPSTKSWASGNYCYSEPSAFATYLEKAYGYTVEREEVA